MVLVHFVEVRILVGQPSFSQSQNIKRDNVILTRSHPVDRLCTMNTILSEQEEQKPTEIHELDQKSPFFHNFYSKNARIPWEPSVLKDIKLQSALTTLRQKELQERLHSFKSI